MKCNILSQQHTETWSTEEAGRSLGSDQAGLEGTSYTHVKQESGSSTSSDSGYEGEWGKYEEAFCYILPHSCQTLSFWSNLTIPTISATWLGIRMEKELECATQLWNPRAFP